MDGYLLFINEPSPDRPVEAKYITEFNGERTYFVDKESAMLHLFDHGVRTFKYLTKELSMYKTIKNLPTYEFWHIHNRVGYVLYDYEPYRDENNQLAKRKAYVWRFVGFGRSCFASTKEELKNTALSFIKEYLEDKDKKGYNIYPFYKRHYRTPVENSL